MDVKTYDGYLEAYSKQVINWHVEGLNPNEISKKLYDLGVRTGGSDGWYQQEGLASLARYMLRRLGYLAPTKRVSKRIKLNVKRLRQLRDQQPNWKSKAVRVTIGELLDHIHHQNTEIACLKWESRLAKVNSPVEKS